MKIALIIIACYLLGGSVFVFTTFRAARRDTTSALQLLGIITTVRSYWQCSVRSAIIILAIAMALLWLPAWVFGVTKGGTTNGA